MPNGIGKKTNPYVTNNYRPRKEKEESKTKSGFMGIPMPTVQNGLIIISLLVTSIIAYKVLFSKNKSLSPDEINKKIAEEINRQRTLPNVSNGGQMYTPAINSVPHTHPNALPDLETVPVTAPTLGRKQEDWSVNNADLNSNNIIDLGSITTEPQENVPSPYLDSWNEVYGGDQQTSSEETSGAVI